MSSSLSGSAEASKPKLLDQIRQLMRLRHYSLRTEEAYIGWIRRKHFSIRTEQAYTDWMIYRHTLNKPGDSNAKPLGSYVKRIQTEGDVSAHGKFAKARTPSPARETRALPQAGASA